MSTETKSLPRYLTVTALARHLELSPDTIYRMERAGKLPGRIAVGKRRVWFAPVIREWEGRTHGTA